MAAATLSSAERTALDSLVSDLRRVLGNRLRAVCAYGLATRTEELRSIVLADGLTFEDFAACVPLARRWDTLGLAVPLMLDADEFVRSLDVFPLEYGEILSDHIVVFGNDPFQGISVSDADRRRACELQAKSHLIHLREGFLETQGDSRAVARLIGASSDGFRRLITNIVGLVAATPSAIDPAHLSEAVAAHIDVPEEVTREVLGAAGGGLSTIVDPTALLARYVAAVERICDFVDGWKRS